MTTILAISRIPTTPKPAAVPSLWNDIYDEIDERLALLNSNKLEASNVATLEEAQAGEADDKYMTPSLVAEAIKKLIPISPDEGNKLDLRDNGIYLGTDASDDVAILYIDAEDGLDIRVDVNGDPVATGTEAAPMKTIQAALARGPAGIVRTLRLKEGQMHYVRPETAAVVRGGTLYIIPYGDGLDAIPHPHGAANYATEDALLLGTKIEATTYVVYGTAVADGGSGIFQNAPALVGNDRATIRPIGITLIPGRPDAVTTIPGLIVPANRTLVPVSRDSGSFNTYPSGANWNFYNCRLKTTFADQRFFSEALYEPLNIFFLSNNYLEGPGKLAIANSKYMSITREAGAAFTDTQLRGMLDQVEISSEVYSSFNTNLIPTSMPSFPARAWAVLTDAVTGAGMHANSFGGNILGHSELGVGRYKVFFDKPMKTVDYLVIATIDAHADNKDAASIIANADGGFNNTLVVESRGLDHCVLATYEANRDAGIYTIAAEGVSVLNVSVFE